MEIIDKIYINGEFVTPHGEELFDLHNPATGQVIGQVRLGDAEDARRAIAAAKQALPAFSRTSKAIRIDFLYRLRDAVLANSRTLIETTVEEYGAPPQRAAGTAKFAAGMFEEAIETLENYDFTRRIGTADVIMQPVGVAGLITPWNSDIGFICSKLAMTIASGCTAVIKPSEMSALQTRAVLNALHEADLPPGIFNIVNGRGEVVGAEITSHPDVAKISFTGSTAVGKQIIRASADTMKRLTLELGGKSPSIILDDADLDQTIPVVIEAGFLNSGQACIAGSRILVPENRYEEIFSRLIEAVQATKVGDPRDTETRIGPMVSQKQWTRVQNYIRLGREEGATLLVGGEGKPEGLDDGYFVKPTLFTNVRNDMTIAREEIFGPVLSLITYKDDEEAIAIANDTTYGLQAYVFSSDRVRAQHVANRIEAGRVFINGFYYEPLTPAGGFKQSGLGREFGVFGLEAFLEPKTLIGHRLSDD